MAPSGYSLSRYCKVSYRTAQSGMFSIALSKIYHIRVTEVHVRRFYLNESR